MLTARAEWAEAEVAVGNATAVLAPPATLADANPLVEPLVVALMRALVAAGRPTEALERFRRHRQRLAEKYGTDPSPQLMRLYETVLRADSTGGRSITFDHADVNQSREPARAATRGAGGNRQVPQASNS